MKVSMACYLDNNTPLDNFINSCACIAKLDPQWQEIYSWKENSIEHESLIVVYLLVYFIFLILLQVFFNYEFKKS